MKRLITISFVLCASTVVAMPSKTDLANAQPLVDELMSSVLKSYKAKTKTAKDVAETAVNFVKDAEEESTKFLLLKGAITFFTRAGEYDKAADVIDMLKAELKDIPPETIAEIIYNATRRTNSNKAPRLFEQYKAAHAQINAQKGLKNLEAELKKRPGNLSLRREYAESLAVFGDWQKALQEFAKLKDRVAEIAKSELEGKAKSAELAEFWWNYKPQVKEADGAIKARAAMHYKKAIDGEEISGLKKTLAEQRIAEIGTAAVTAAVEGSKEESVNEPPPGCKFITKGNEATLVFPNGVTMEFAKCPAGEFNMLYDYEKKLTTPVKITRPFWFSKTYLQGRHLHAAMPEKERYKKHKENVNCIEDSYDNIVGSNDSIVKRLNEDFGSFFPKGYVVRLPSIAEYEYAYHANTKDRNDPFYSNNQWDISEEQRNVIISGKANKWGICDMGMNSRFLDCVDPKEMLECLVEKEGDDRGAYFSKYRMKQYHGKPVGKDPFLWSEIEKPYYIFRGHRVFTNRFLGTSDKYGRYHLVIGPDLVREWRAKNKKK